MTDWLNRVHFGDCREVMKAWPAGVADACITDPPYGDTSLDWDRRCAGWMAEVARVLKPAASVWVFGSMRYLATVFAEMEAHGFRYAQDIVWEKQNGTGFHNDRFKRVHEHAIQFYRGAWADIFKDPQFTHDARAKVVRRKTPAAASSKPTSSARCSTPRSRQGSRAARAGADMKRTPLKRTAFRRTRPEGPTVEREQHPRAVVAPCGRWCAAPMPAGPQRRRPRPKPTGTRRCWRWRAAARAC
jgi:hypothetical protein